jgi:hypothetical protein
MFAAAAPLLVPPAGAWVGVAVTPGLTGVVGRSCASAGTLPSVSARVTSVERCMPLSWLEASPTVCSSIHAIVTVADTVAIAWPGCKAAPSWRAPLATPVRPRPLLTAARLRRPVPVPPIARLTLRQRDAAGASVRHAARAKRWQETTPGSIGRGRPVAWEKKRGCRCSVGYPPACLGRGAREVHRGPASRQAGTASGALQTTSEEV